MAFAKDTLVEMADGRQCPITHIRNGDWIRSVNGGMVSVSNIFTGMEQELLRIEVEEHVSLLLTPNSVIKTQEGFKRACHLVVSDLVECADGEFVAIQKIETIPYDDKVCVLCLDDGETHYANGIVVGSMELEQQLDIRK